MESLYLSFTQNSKKINLRKEYKGLEEFDYHTLFYTKKEFLEKVMMYFHDSSFVGTEPYISCIMNQKYKTYECLFISDNSQHLNKVLSLFQTLALEKTNVNHYILLDEFDELVYILLNNITADRNKIRDILAASSDVDQKLKDYFRSVYSTRNFSELYPFMKKKLANYMVLRSLVIKYAHLIMKNNVFEESITDSYYSMEDVLKLRKAYYSFFSSAVVAELYRIGGAEKVVSSLDANELFNLPLEDLLKLGVIDEKYYLKRTLK